MSEKTLFEKIADREIPGEFVYEDELCFCIRDISPQAPVHLLLIPKKPIPRLGVATEEDQDLLGHLMTRVPLITAQEGVNEEGFRVVINSGPNAGEVVPHLHLHLLGGHRLHEPMG